jgi:hypothetical protein
MMAARTSAVREEAPADTSSMVRVDAIGMPTIPADQCTPSGARRFEASQMLLALRTLFARPAQNSRASLVVRDGNVPVGFRLNRNRRAEANAAIRSREVSIPRPWSVKPADIVENFWHGVAATRMDQVPRLDVLRRGELTVRDVIPVSRMSGGRSYYLLHLVDRAGRIAMAATVDAQGWLLELEDGRDHQPRRPVDLTAARILIESKRGASRVRALRFVLASGNAEPGSSQFAPLAMIERDDGTFYVNAGSDVFADSESGGGINTDGPLVVRGGVRRRLERVQ